MEKKKWENPGFLNLGVNNTKDDADCEDLINDGIYKRPGEGDQPKPPSKDPTKCPNYCSKCSGCKSDLYGVRFTKCSHKCTCSPS